MPSDLHAELEIVAEARRYHEWLASALNPHLIDPVLELGSGLGTLAANLDSLGRVVMASEPNPAMAVALVANVRALPTVTVAAPCSLPAVDQIMVSPLPASVLMSNVLEHIEHDVDALSSLLTHLPAVDRLVLVVPAHRWAHTGLDDRLGHYRRYTDDSLAEVITSAGWEVSMIKYFNPIGALSWAISGHVFRRTSIRSWQTTLVEALVPLLRLVDRTVSGRWVGQSIIAVADRPS